MLTLLLPAMLQPHSVDVLVRQYLNEVALKTRHLELPLCNGEFFARAVSEIHLGDEDDEEERFTPAEQRMDSVEAHGDARGVKRRVALVAASSRRNERIEVADGAEVSIRLWKEGTVARKGVVER